MADKQSIAVTVLGQEYRIRSEGDAETVREAAALLDETMVRVRARTRTVDSMGVAVLAALNLAKDVVTRRRESGAGEMDAEALARLGELADRVEQVLADDDATAA